MNTVLWQHRKITTDVYWQILVYQIKLLLFLPEIWYYFVEDNALKERDA